MCYSGGYSDSGVCEMITPQETNEIRDAISGPDSSAEKLEEVLRKLGFSRRYPPVSVVSQWGKQTYDIPTRTSTPNTEHVWRGYA